MRDFRDLVVWEKAQQLALASFSGKPKAES
jgi:hypothetical protein